MKLKKEDVCIKKENAYTHPLENFGGCTDFKNLSNWGNYLK